MKYLGLNVLKMTASLMRCRIAALLLVTLVATLFSGCARAWEKGSFRERWAERSSAVQNLGGRYESMTYRGVERRFYLYVPPSIGQTDRVPLLLGLHGTLGRGEGFAAHSGFNALADRERFIAVYPDAIDRQWNDGRFGDDYVNDVGFIQSLLQMLKEKYPIDTRRIYSTGISNGGIFTQLLACSMSDEIAAFASVVAALPVKLAPHCNPSRPVPLLMINGADDQLVPYAGGEVAGGRFGRYGGGKVLSVPDTLDFWAGRDGCSRETTVSLLPDRDPADGTRIRRTVFRGCRAGSEVVLYLVEGGGHAWPGSAVPPVSARSGTQSRDISASEVIWSFFKNHPLP